MEIGFQINRQCAFLKMQSPTTNSLKIITNKLLMVLAALFVVFIVTAFHRHKSIEWWTNLSSSQGIVFTYNPSIFMIEPICYIILISAEPRRLLHFYAQRDLVQCLDNISGNDAGQKQLHFAFIGDSRIRQHYLNFLKVSYYFIIA